MANEYIDSTLLDKALHFAIDAHANTERREKGYPYIVHILEAVEIVATLTSDQELLAAAALHDTVEDTAVTVDEIRELFGERVAAIVAAESDNVTEGINKNTPWREKKEAALNVLRNAPREVKVVAMGDKLSNMRAIARDYKTMGDELWRRFHAPNGKLDHRWRYNALADALSELEGSFAYTEFKQLVQETFNV